MSSESRTDAAMATSDSTRAVKYHQAAVLYFAHGVLYLAQVVALGVRSGWEMTNHPRAPVWIFLPLGALITVALPYFVWRQVRWLTAVLAALVFATAVYFFVQPNVGFFLGPFLVAAVTAWMLARAAWDL